MRILVISGDYKCGNIGDVAMLQVAVARLKRQWPEAKIQIFTDDPGSLLFHCPDVEPLSHRGRRIWCSDQQLIGRLGRRLPKPISNSLRAINRVMREHSPSLLAHLIAIKLRVLGADYQDLDSFITSFDEADVVVACGQAGMNDLVRSHMLALLDLFEMAVRAGKITAMFSQGVGPMTDIELRSRARSVLPGVDLIALRESRGGWPILQSSGVLPERVLITGDDAVELAYINRNKSPGRGIGVNVRLAKYAGVDNSSLAKIRPLIHEFGNKVGAELIPIPISRHEELRDAMALRQLLAGYNGSCDGGRDLDTPLKVIQQTGRCRIVVTGAYHAAVFALSQGIPAVCLCASEYVADKFRGLLTQFGDGCYIVNINSLDLAKELFDTLESAWNDHDRVRNGLLEAARKQVESAILAYRRIWELSEFRKSAA